MALAGSLEIRLMADVARIKADMDKASGIVSAGAKAMERAAAGVKSAFAGIAAGMSVAAFANWIRSATEAADAQGKLSQKIGVATQDIGGLQLAYQLAGGGSDIMTSSLSKLVKAVSDGNSGLAAIGVRTKDAAGNFRGTKDVLYDVADVFAKMPDDLQRTAIAIEIFGKSGAEMIPLLISGSEGLKEMDAMARKLGLTVDAETAKAANEFNDTLELLHMSSEGLARQVSTQLLPLMNGLAASFLESKTQGDKLSNTATVIANVLKGLYTVGVATVEVFSTIGKYWGGIFAALNQVRQGNFGDAMRVLKEMGTDIGAGWADSAKMISRAWGDEGNAAVAAAAKTFGAGRNLLAEQKAREEAAKRAAAEAQKAADEYQKLVEKITGKSLGTDPDFLKNLALLATQGQKAGLSLEQISELQTKYIYQQQYMVKAEKDAMEVAKERQKQREEEAKGIRDYMLAQEAAQASAKKSGEEQLAAIQFEAQALTMSSTARELAIKMRELEKTGLDKNSEAYQKLASDIRSATLELEKGKEAQEAKRRSEALADSIADGIMDGFRRGKSFAEVFLNELKAQFAKTVLSPILRPITEAGNGLLGGVLKQVVGALGGMTPGGSAESNLPDNIDVGGGWSPAGLSFAGGGYTGNGSRAGGVDGMGGFWAVMHPQESVIDHAAGQGAGNVFSPTVTVNVDSRSDRAAVIADVQRVVNENNKAWAEQLGIRR